VTRRAVTKAELRRVLDVLAERGQKVAEVVQSAGEIHMRLTDGTDAPLPSPDLSDSDFAARLTEWRRSA
jgi:hypothetical protein